MANRIFNRKELKQRRKELRNNTTAAEAVLWSLLKTEDSGAKRFENSSVFDNPEAILETIDRALN